MKHHTQLLLLDSSTSPLDSRLFTFSRYSELLNCSNPAFPHRIGATSSSMMIARKNPIDCVIHMMAAIDEF
jgi:hypothetical protein